MTSPLSAIRVLDLSRILAGPWATQMLADLGADVLKIEKPLTGDDTRGWGPPFITNADGSVGDAAYFLCANRGKSSLAIDITTPEGQALIKGLLQKSDVLVENYKVGGLKKYGLDYETLRHEFPQLIYCSITGFGQTGPDAAQAGYDFMIQGRGGLMSITGQPDAQPTKVGVAYVDIITGLHASIGILAALYARNNTGRGQHIDLSLLDSQVAVLANQALNYLVSGKVPGRLGSAHPNIVPYQAFGTADGHMTIAVGNDRQFADFARVIGKPELAQDPRFIANRGRVENRDILIPLLADVLCKQTTQHWIEQLEAATIPCGAIQDIAQVFNDPQVIAREMVLSSSRTDGTTTPGVANPLRFSDTPVTQNRPAPSLGEGTMRVLHELLDLEPAQLAKLKEQGIIQ